MNTLPIGTLFYHTNMSTIWVVIESTSCCALRPVMGCMAAISWDCLINIIDLDKAMEYAELTQVPKWIYDYVTVFETEYI